MAKMNDDKASMYLVAIVGVVAAVGIVVLLMGGVGTGDYSGQALRAMNSGTSSASISSTLVSSSGVTLGVSEGCVTRCCQRTNTGCESYCTECS